MSDLSVWQQAAIDSDLTIELPTGVPLFFRLIKAGEFCMGSRGYKGDEEPVHRVVISHDFFLGTFLVTQEQYRAVAECCSNLDESDPSDFKGARRPVETVSWHDATAFCDWLTADIGSELNVAAGLPTEAQWEFACRGGRQTEYYSGDGEETLAQVGWFGENSGGETHDVDERDEKHPLGLHGMHGNVWEWCHDDWDANAYRKRPDGVEDPVCTGGDEHQLRVLRGGSWFNSAVRCRSAYRLGHDAGLRFGYDGFRVCLVRSPAATDSGAKKERE